MNEKGQFVGSMSEDGVGRTVVNCRTLLPSFCPPLPILMPVKEVSEEALVAVVDIGLVVWYRIV